MISKEEEKVLVEFAKKVDEENMKSEVDIDEYGLKDELMSKDTSLD